MQPTSQQILEWIKSGMKFKPIVIKSNKVKGLSINLNWEVGEGFDGDYNFQNKEDAPLLRFDIINKKAPDSQDQSFCTYLCVLDDRKTLEKAAAIILKDSEKRWLDEDASTDMSAMSWIRIENNKVIVGKE